MNTGSADVSTRVVERDTFMRILKASSEAVAAIVEAELKSCEGKGTTQVRVAFSRLGRKSETAALVGTSDSAALPGFESPPFFTADIVARVAFLKGLETGRSGVEFSELLITLYRAGSQPEQVSVLRALPWLAQPENLVSLASEACRTNDVRVFSALCSENPFPAAHLSDQALFQMVLKAMFLEVDTTHTLGLVARTNEELIRMVLDFKKEREAAGRTIPQDAKAILEAS